LSRGLTIFYISTSMVLLCYHIKFQRFLFTRNFLFFSFDEETLLQLILVLVTHIVTVMKA